MDHVDLDALWQCSRTRLYVVLRETRLYKVARDKTPTIEGGIKVRSDRGEMGAWEAHLCFNLEV